MKIVGIASRTSYLCEVSSDEMNHLTGEHSFGWSSVSDEMIGKKFDIQKAWNVIRELKSQREALPNIANKLRALADILQPIQLEIPTEVKNEG